MNELEAKLLKRRSVVEECGANYESVPSIRKEADEATAVSAAATPLKTCGAVFKRTPSSGGGDFQAAIDRRRATVDGDGQTFESTPTTKMADVTSSASTPTGASPAGIRPSCGAVDFKKRIDQQRASVDGGAETFESRPTEHSADAGLAVPSPSKSSGQVFESTPEKTTADCVSSIRSAMQLPAAPELQLPASTVQELEEQQEEDEVGDEDEMDSCPSPTHSTQAKEPKTTLSASDRRVLWLVGLVHPLQDAFESDQFAVAGCSPVSLRLRADGHKCHLELKGPEDAFGSYEVKLFVGKGWKKKAF
ncbi:PETH, partial [Symbiodinium pilosum]